MASSDVGVAGGSTLEVEDEFACAGMLRGSVLCLHSSVERIFKVAFTIGDDSTPGESNGQIWLKLRGSSDDVKTAKLFVRGVVNQEEQQEMSYPSVLHSIFCGARGLFMDSLIRNTSAHIVIGSPGFLLISGLETPVVQAFSLISNLIDKYEETLSIGQGSAERALEETLDSHQAFKALVEKWKDQHALNLLTLPASVKEILLELVNESGLDLEGNGSSHLTFGVVDGTVASPESGSVVKISSQGLIPPPGTQQWAEKQQRLNAGLDQEVQSPKENEFGLLLNFFTAMGYTEDVVKRVLSQTGLKEASQILDLVLEQDGSEQGQSLSPNKDTEINRPCETEHQEDKGRFKLEEPARSGRAGLCAEQVPVNGAEMDPDDDFVLGVLKKAAASCGYSEQNVTKVYSMLPERSTHRLLLELQKREGGKDGPKEQEDVDQDVSEPPRLEVKSGRESHTLVPQVKVELLERAEFPDLRPKPKLQVIPSKPKQTQLPKANIVPPKADLIISSPSCLPKQPPPTTSWFDAPTHAKISQPHHAHQHSPLPSSHAPMRANDAQTVFSSVTGEQRFLEGLQTRFKLKLSDQPGDPNLRMIVIDGSNVAMSHGLGHFFSCRGIALAVQHFWDRGHRHIQAMLPRWRQKSDPRKKEDHFLNELHDLGLLSYTPSREVKGERISSYDDRFLLELAHRNDGVIVTNDNLRDLMDESTEWMEIIRRRLLQYTFVGDHFMVPDDPLGRRGPPLDQFLRSDRRIPDPVSHPRPAHTGALSESEPTLEGDPGQWSDRRNGSESTRRRRHEAPRRSLEQTAALRESLNQVFPDQDHVVTLVLQCHPAETDINALSAFLLEEQLGPDSSQR